MTDTDATYAIFLGADLDGGRFAGIGALSANDLAGLEPPLPRVDEVWGVAMRLPGTRVDGPVVPVALRAGEYIQATVLTVPADLDDPEAVLAEARY